jgi:crotonobetainyl-CoA:carnitine CoA-transferase CaiB-like acyl-CoA transferase
MDKKKILDGVKVLDFTHVVAGPVTTRSLSDLGADVIKVDKPPVEGQELVRSAGSVANNIGKRSIAIDLKSESGIKLARKMAQSVDIIVENFRPGAMKDLGLDYDTLSSTNRSLIYASISGFGQSGSQSHRRAYGANAHAEAGWLWVQQGAAESGAPFAPGVTVADILTAMNTVSGILAALYHRQKTGLGQWIDVTLAESQFSFLAETARTSLSGSPESDWRPFRHPIHAAKDGNVTINIGGGQDSPNWRRIAKAFGHDDEPMPLPVESANALVTTWVSELTVGEIASRMESTGAPYGIVSSIHEAVNNPYFEERGMLFDVPDSIDGAIRVIGSPIHFSDASSSPNRTSAPLAGEHSREILRLMEYRELDIEELIRSGAVVEQLPPSGGK